MLDEFLLNQTRVSWDLTNEAPAEADKIGLAGRSGGMSFKPALNPRIADEPALLALQRSHEHQHKSCDDS
jgi:hypothetical protein